MMGRLGRHGLYAVLVSTALMSGCAPYRDAARVDGGGRPAPVAANEVPRADRGNPPFYDVLGKRYYVLKTSQGYRQTGIASWYGREFHGLATSSGEPYNMHAMTAAHTTLPIPTWVEVTNLDNGKRVVVKVNDRGPFVDNRLIDLSYAAAQALDMVRNGTARVEVRALGTPVVPADSTTVTAVAAPVSRATVVPVAVAAPATASGGTVSSDSSPAAVPAPPAEQLFVQVGAFTQRDNALKLLGRLRSHGFGNSFIVTDHDGSRTLHRVRLGPLEDAREFDALSGRLRHLGVGESRLVVER